MNAIDLYRSLASRDIRLTVEGGALKADAPAGALTPSLLREVLAAKPALLALLQEQPIFVDIETRSLAHLRWLGGRAYAAHPSTEVLCVVALMPNGTFIDWLPDDGPPNELLDAVRRGVPLVAHNGLGFDRFIWERLGWAPARWVDTLQLARLLGLPGELDALGTRLLGRGKDVAGRKLTLALSRVDRRTGALGPIDDLTLARVVVYCRADVEMLRDLWFSRLAPSSEREASIREVDRIINDRGFLLDDELAQAVIACDAQLATSRRALAAVSEDVLRSTAQFKAWLAANGVQVPDTRRETLRVLLAREDLPEHVRNVINGRIASSGIATPKLRRGLVLRSPDGRVRDGLLYHAAHTGRWGGRGLQPHNLPRGVEVDIDAAVAAALTRDVGALARLARDARATDEEVIASLVRPTIVAPVGRVLGTVDFASIEARGLLWLVRDEPNLAIYRTDADPYCVMAAALFGLAVEDISKEQRQLGKALVLGCGYQMGADRFRAHAAQQGVDWGRAPVTPFNAVEAWRDRHPLVAGWKSGATHEGHVLRLGGFWKLLEHAAHRAAEGEGTEVGRTTWLRDGTDVVCVLPSGRPLVYGAARIEEVEQPRGKRKVFTYAHHRGRAYAYGGKLAENVTQAVCRDLLADALVRLEAAGIEVVLHVHDEVVAELDSVEQLAEMETVMRTAPTWATDFPIAVKGQTASRYRK